MLKSLGTELTLADTRLADTQPSLQLRFFRCPCMSLRLGRSRLVLIRIRPGGVRLCALRATQSPASWKFCIHNASQWKCAFAHGQAAKLARYRKKEKEEEEGRRGEGRRGNACQKKPTISQNASWYFTVRFICKSTLVNICKIYFDLFKTCSTFFSLHPLPKFLFLPSSQLFKTFSKNSRRDASYVLSIKLKTSKSRAPKHQ